MEGTKGKAGEEVKAPQVWEEELRDELTRAVEQACTSGRTGIEVNPNWVSSRNAALLFL